MSRLLLVGIAIVLACGCESSSPSPRPATSVAQMSPLQQAAIAFEGSHSEQEIRTKLDEALTVYGLPTTDENYSRAGSVLVTMRKEYGSTEMQILDHMVRSHVPGVNVSFPEAAALSAVFLASGDR